MVKILPFPTRRFVIKEMKGTKSADGGGVEGDGLKFFGFRGSECGIDPPDSRIARSKLHVLETCSSGEIK